MSDLALANETHNSTALWYNPDNNRHYRVFEKLGESKECKMSG